MKEDIALKNQKKKPARKRVETPFAKNLELIINERRLTLRAVSELSDVPIPTVADWLKGVVPHDILKVKKLADALGLSFEGLLTSDNGDVFARDFTLSEFKEEHAFSGLFRIEAKRLVKK